MALVHLLHKCYEACDELGSSLRICLFAFSKAFDRIDHNVLLRKLQQMAVHPVLINWIADVLSNILQRTKTGQDYSAWKYIQASVPQGTKLGPLLFLIMGNYLKPAKDLVKFVDHSTTWEVLHRYSQSNQGRTLGGVVGGVTPPDFRNRSKVGPEKCISDITSSVPEHPIYYRWIYLRIM